ncbi:MAG: tRNA pseudouridine(38-40) synthase TruA [Bacteroidota bacterium]|nr:tRNA pseudouridine(38-40) synthase TruA [Candidatus Kapabacteria bacterium]MDW8219287.1 tRNA pseudouridine(38-40) synthase TruA [Bacteroidota bacterium]
MARFKLTLEYEGTRYSGWQIQKNARTVQGEMLKALERVLKLQDIELYGAGRTDAGVHALGQVAHVDAQTVLAPHILRMKLNDELPSDINVLHVEKVPKSFHARYDAVARQYLYQISRRRTAFGKRFVWWVKDTLNLEQMRAAARLFVGEYDFRSFTAADLGGQSTQVALDMLSLQEVGNLILIRIRGSRFLWKMVRQMVGILVEIGRGALPPDIIHDLLEHYSTMPAAYTAPPSGLFLERVFYKQDTLDVAAEPVMYIH